MKIAAFLIYFALSSKAFAGPCGPSYVGIWEHSGSANGQHAYMKYRGYENLTQIKSVTGLRKSAAVNNPAPLDIIYDIVGYSGDNFTMTPVSGGGCLLNISRMTVLTDPYNSYPNRSEVVLLNRIGADLRWCWEREDHQFGSCIFLQPSR